MNGERVEIPFRINVKGVTAENFDQLYSNIEMNKGLDFVIPQAYHFGKVAIVGGGSSLKDSIDILQKWGGDIWSINKTHDWLLSHGISSTFATVDAEPDIKYYSSPENVKRSLFASHCDPILVRMYEGRRLFNMSPLVPNGIHGGSSTAVSLAFVALFLGYRDVTFFGCDSSFKDSTHVDRNDYYPNQLIIRACSEDYVTTPPLYCQVQELSRLIKLKPEWFKEKSGGLLRAMVTDDQWSIVAVSEHLKNHLEDYNGKFGLFDLPYVR